MGNTLERVDDGASQVVSWVRLVLVAGFVMGVLLAAEEDWVAEALYLVLHVHLRTNTELFNFAGEHLIEDLHVALRGSFAVRALNSLVSLLLHLFSWSVISVGKTSANELAALLNDLVEVVRSVRDLVWDDLERGQVAHDVFEELDLFVHWIRVIKAQYHLPIVHLSLMVVEHGSLNVTDVEVTRWFRWESSHYLTFDSAFEDALELRVIRFAS